MKRNTKNLGKSIRTKEEIEARRQERRRYYEELEAFERDLPDFIFEDDNNEAEIPGYDEEPETENIEQEDISDDIDTVELEEVSPEDVPKADAAAEEAEQNTEELPENEEAEVSAEESEEEPAEGLQESSEMTWIEIMETAEEKAMTCADQEDDEEGTNKAVLPERMRSYKNSERKRSARPANARQRKGRRRRRRANRRLIGAAAVLLVIVIVASTVLNALGIVGGKELYEVYINDTLVGTVEEPEISRSAYLQVRREVVSNETEPVLMEADYNVKKTESFVKRATDAEELQQNMKDALEDSLIGTLNKNYVVKINDYIVHLNDKTEVVELLESVKNNFDEDNEFSVQLVTDTSRELSVLTTQIVKSEAGTDIAGMVDVPTEEADPGSEETEEDTKLPEVVGDSDGLKEVAFVEDVEIAESYVSTANIIPVEDAISEITKEKEESQIYEIAAGDSLSVVANNHGMKVAKLLELNEHLSESSVLQIGDEIVITVPQPELSVITKEEVTYEEDYNAPVQYIDNDSWYTTKQVVKQEPVAGHHKVTAIVTYNNGKEVDREFIAETVTSEPVPKIVERGTQTPPTYIKPLSGGTLTSGYKYRWGRWHRGVDWACPTGTTIFASCGGTVASAGWSSSYGYVITISHPDGRQTRYAHLSKILVSSGQKVKQGQKIALSGNTGRSTGPHLHFEIIINGSKVNPMKYLN